LGKRQEAVLTGDTHETIERLVFVRFKTDFVRWSVFGLSHSGTSWRKA
jgi:hypothetical protein